MHEHLHIICIMIYLTKFLFGIFFGYKILKILGKLEFYLKANKECTVS